MAVDDLSIDSIDGRRRSIGGFYRWILSMAVDDLSVDSIDGRWQRFIKPARGLSIRARLPGVLSLLKTKSVRSRFVENGVHSRYTFWSPADDRCGGLCKELGAASWPDRRGLVSSCRFGNDRRRFLALSRPSAYFVQNDTDPINNGVRRLSL